MSSEDFFSTGGRRRRSTEPGNALDLYKTDAVSAGERLQDAADIFPQWPEILETFRTEFVERANEFGGIAEMRANEERFQEFVGDFVFRHGSEFAIAPKDQRRLLEFLSRYIFGYRGLEKYLELNGLEEIIFNNWSDGFYIVHGEKKRITEQIFESEEDLLGFVRNIAAANGREINEASPALDAMLDDGSRVNSTLNGIAVGGTDLVIRKHRPEMFTVDEYVQGGMLTREALHVIGDLIRRGANTIVSGGTGTGKAQPIDAPVLTPSGWRPIGELRVGDRVIGADGEAHSVIGVFPQGEKEIFKVIFNDGSSTECCREHLWAVRTKGQTHRGSGFQTKSLDELINDVRYSDGTKKWFIPIVQPVNYDANETLPLDPYLLGTLLSDGHLNGWSPDISSADESILAAVGASLPEGMKLVARDPERRPYDFRLTHRVPGRANPVMQSLRDLGLKGTRSWDKFVPELYKTASAADRLAILQGLCDTDGTVAPGTCDVEFSTSSERLALDVRELVESLGGTARTKSRVPTYTYRGKKLQGRLSYRVRVKLPAPLNPFRLERKASLYVAPTKYEPARAIESIEPVGSRQAICIAVSALDQLYVTNNFIVTHNTTFLNTLGNEFIPPEDRLLIIEDTHELRIRTADTKYFQTRQRATGLRQSNTDITIRELFRFCLRKLPTRIIIGEVRGAEAYDALSAWNSGHEGSFMTIHANRAVTALSKLQQFARGTEDGMDDEGVRDLIAQAADIVVQLRRIHGKRKVVEIIQVFHPDDLRDALGNEQITKLVQSGLLRKVWPNCYVMSLFKLQNDSLVKVADPLPLPGEIE